MWIVVDGDDDDDDDDDVDVDINDDDDDHDHDDVVVVVLYTVQRMGEKMIRFVNLSRKKTCSMPYALRFNTPPKTNMEPENEPLEEEIPMKNHHS